MTYKEFENQLQTINLNKKEFANIVDMSYTSVTNWKQSDSIPNWVDSWLYYYKKSKILDDFIESIQKHEALTQYKNLQPKDSIS